MTTAIQPELLAVGPAEVQTLATRDAWLEARRHGIGASDAAAVVGVSPYKSALDLYCEKLGIAEADPVESEAMEWGLLLEPVLAARYQHVTGREVQRAPLTLLRSRAHPFMLLSPDGFLADPGRGRGVIEFKTASAYKAEEWEAEPPLAYQIQLQHAMAVADVAWGVLAVLIGGQRFLHFDVARNDRFLAVLIDKEQAFWRRLTTQEPPPIDGSEASKELLRRLYPRDTPGLVVNLPAEAIEWDAELQAAKGQGKAAEARCTELENRIKAAIGEAEAGVCTNGVTFTWKATERKGYTVPAATMRTLRRKEGKA